MCWGLAHQKQARRKGMCGAELALLGKAGEAYQALAYACKGAGSAIRELDAPPEPLHRRARALCIQGCPLQNSAADARAQIQSVLQAGPRQVGCMQHWRCRWGWAHIGWGPRQCWTCREARAQ